RRRLIVRTSREWRIGRGRAPAQRNRQIERRAGRAATGRTDRRLLGDVRPLGQGHAARGAERPWRAGSGRILRGIEGVPAPSWRGGGGRRARQRRRGGDRRTGRRRRSWRSAL